VLLLLHAGLVVAGRHFGAVVIVTLSISLLASHGLTVEEAFATGGNNEAIWISASPFLIRAYLLIATGLALSTGRSIFYTALYFRHVSRLIRIVSPQLELKTLAVQLGLSAIMLAVLAVRAPEFIVEVGRQFGLAAATSTIGWAGAMSIGVACMGASAHAALKALGDHAAD
jgi:hypothetical protein